MDRRTFLLKAGAAAATACSATALPAEQGRRLNLLFITVDDMNWSLPGFMGNTLGLTPNLDHLASTSQRFTKNRTTAPICQPSREAMMTGRVPHRSGGLGFDPIHEGVPTLVTVLQQAGYYAGAIHKTEHMQPESCFPWDFAVKGISRLPSEYSNSLAEAMSQARAANKPFFINCNINDPHRPFYGSREAAQLDHNDEGEYHVPHLINADQVTVPPFLEDLPAAREELAQYCNSAQRMDISIGKLLTTLEASPEAKNTIIFFSADHGMPFPFSKATVYDYGTRTPALLKVPGMPSGREFRSRTCNVDYMPTLLDLLGVAKPAGMDGISWVPLMRGGHDAGREYVVTHVNGVASGGQYPARCIQDERYSLIFMPWADGKLALRTESMSGLTFPAMVKAGEADSKIMSRVNRYLYGIKWAMYDLESDPGQRMNLWDEPSLHRRRDSMLKRLRAAMAESSDPQLENFDRTMHAEATIVPQPASLRRSPE